MALDLAVVLLLLLAVIHGWSRGLIAQALGLAGLVAVWWGSPRLVGPIRAWLAGHGQAAGLPLELISLALAVGCVVAVTWLLMSIVPSAVRNMSESAGQADRALGAAAGAVRGAVILWMLFATLAWAEPTLTRGVPALRSPMRDSHAVAAARNWNIWRLIDVDRLDDLRRSLAHGARGHDAAPPLLLEVLADGRLRDATRRGDDALLLADPRVVAVLADAATRDEVAMLTNLDDTMPASVQAPSTDSPQ